MRLTHRRSLSRPALGPCLVLGLSLGLGGCVAAQTDIAAMDTLADRAPPRTSAQFANAPSALCSPVQRAVIVESFAKARLHLDRAVHFVRHRPNDPHIQRWFGEAPADVVLSTLEATSEGMRQPVGLECNHPRACSDNKIAYARRRSGVLGVCPRFFQAESTGIDSRFGILIHEMTHLAARTDDHTYQPGSASLVAKTQPMLSAHNADNYEYFVETLPTAP